MTILIITNRLDYTADFVVLELQKRNLDYVRINTESLATDIEISWTLDDETQSYFEIRNRQIHLNDVESIWYRRPVLPLPPPAIVKQAERDFISQETRAAFQGIWRSLDCLWVSHPDNLFAASFKPVQLKVARDLGFKVPSTIVTNVPIAARNALGTWGQVSTNQLQKPELKMLKVRN